MFQLSNKYFYIHITQEDRDEDSQGGNSDDEIAELRIQALLSKRVNEAEVSPAHDPSQDKHHNINKPLPIGPPQSFRQQVRTGDWEGGREWGGWEDMEEARRKGGKEGVGMKRRERGKGYEGAKGGASPEHSLIFWVMFSSHFWDLDPNIWRDILLKKKKKKFPTPTLALDMLQKHHLKKKKDKYISE